MEKDIIAVAGTGRSGIAAARMIIEMGGHCLLYNSDKNTDVKKVLKEFGRKKPKVITGELKKEDLDGVSLFVMSPGIPLTADFVKVADDAKIPVIGELELGFQASRGKIAAVTGTNGKTTVTSLLGEIFKKQYNDVYVAGNIGIPFCEVADKTDEDSKTVLEVSSFMLETIMNFHPSVSVILNITPDHLDRHGTMRNYIRTKEAITLNQTADDTVVLNYDDKELRRFGQLKKLKPQVFWFSTQNCPPGNSVYLSGSKIIVSFDGKRQDLLDVKDLIIIGKHNYENVCAAACAALAMGVSPENIREAAVNFKAVPHRIEFVRERLGVRYYNDSKGTNPDAAIKALLSMPSPCFLIGGGYDKGGSFDEWVRLFPGRVKKLVLMGATRDRIFECCRSFGFTDVVFVDNMDEAVRTCASYANPGDCVLLSPACASWDMYKDFEERGDDFKKLVNGL